MSKLVIYSILIVQFYQDCMGVRFAHILLLFISISFTCIATHHKTLQTHSPNMKPSLLLLDFTPGQDKQGFKPHCKGQFHHCTTYHFILK